VEVGDSWRSFYEKRMVIRRRYPRVWSIPLERRALDVVRLHVTEGQSCLDIGGSARFWEGMEHRLPPLEAKTLNVDPSERCDYRSLDEVDELFDVVIMLEMIEHVPLHRGLTMLSQARERLKPGGKIIVTTPNLFHPHRYWDATHVAPYRYDELGAALLSTGFEVIEMWRLYNAAFVGRWFRRLVGQWLNRYLDVDFALSVAAVGTPAGDAGEPT